MDLSQTPAVASAEPAPAALGTRIVTLIAIILPFIGLLAGIVLLWEHGITAGHLAVFLAMYFLTGLGVTVGYHRLFTHRSFETTRTVKLVFAVLGSMAVQGPLLKWVANHRQHHQHSDTPDDPHSPHGHGGGFIGVLKGWWHAHVGWLLRPDAPDLYRYVGDLMEDNLLRKVSALFPLWVLLGLLIPTALGGILTQSWFGALLGFTWGGLARIFLIHHVTWSVNSACHLWGGRPFRSRDESRNNIIFGFLALGEGWHNNHHAFPTSARHGLGWWQFDITYLVIRFLEVTRLAWRVRVPAPELVANRSREPVVELVAT